MPNVLRRAAIAVSAAAACAVALSVPAAHAATTSPAPQQWTTNWAGYYAKASAPVISAVANFTVPRVSCDQSRGTPQTGNDGNKYQAMMWVGIGGIDGLFGINSGWLKQAGVVVSCKNLNAAPTYQPFWEYFPRGNVTVTQGSPFAPQYFKAKNGKTAELQPGDNVEVQVEAPSVSPVKGKWYFRMYVESSDGLSSSTFTASQYLAANTNGPDQTAEVITEMDASGLVNLGSVEYNSAQYIATSDLTQSAVGVPIPVQPIYLLNGAAPHAVIIYPSAPYVKFNPGIGADTFTTNYATNWLR